LNHGNEQVLPAALHDAQIAPQVSTREVLDLLGYGYGVQTLRGFLADGSYYPVQVLTHDGAIAGYSAMVFAIPELDLGFAALVSTDNAAQLKEVIRATIGLVTLPASAPAPDLAAHPETFAEEVGTYQDPHGAGAIEIALSGGQLTFEAKAVGASGALTPIGPRNFLATFQGLQQEVTFLHQPSGQVYLRTRDLVAVR
jgi:hypothetical protein